MRRVVLPPPARNNAQVPRRRRHTRSGREVNHVTTTDDALARIRGTGPPKPHNARTIAALTGNPGCSRRALMDAAGIDKQQVAAHIGVPVQTGRSRFAITRGNAFEAQIKRNGYAELLRLLHDQLGLPVGEAAWTDVSIGADDGLDARHARTRELVRQAATTGTGTLFDHPLLRIDVAGRPAFLEPDLIAVQVAGRFHVVEIKSFAVIDGRADGAKVAAAAIQAAVYVLALRELLADLGHGPDRVADEIILICPENFANRPTATLIDVRPQLTVLRRQLSRMARIDALVADVPGGLSLDLGIDGAGVPQRSPAEIVAALHAIPARYAPECLAACELAYFCRGAAGDDTAALGRSVRDDLGGIAGIADALDLAHGVRTPREDEVEAATMLAAAARMRRAILPVPR
jgi:hypothetical protein